MTQDQIAAILGMKIVDPVEMKEAALEELEQLGAKLRDACDPEARAGIVKEVLDNPDALRRLSTLRVDRATWASATVKISAIRGCPALIKKIEQAIGLQEATRIGVRVVGDDEREALPAQLPEGYRVPSGWAVRRGGVYVVETSETKGSMERQVAHGGLWVTARLVDGDTGIHQLRLAWYGDHGEWMERVVARSVAGNAVALVSVSDDGCPATSTNAGELVRYLAASAAANSAALPGLLSLGRCGWSAGGFLLGDEWIGDPDQAKVLHAEDGMAEVAGGCGVSGTWEGWVEVMEAVADLPYPWLAVWGAIGSVLLKPLGQRMGFILDFSGETSTGKSSVLEAGISTYGDPRGPGFLTWKNTIPGIEASLYTLHHLPIALDDTKQAETHDFVSDVIYMAANGCGKGRGAPPKKGSPVGKRLTAKWLSGVLSTGEQKPTSFTRDEGAAARTICMEGMPFGGKGPVFRRRAVALTRGVKAHHGHLMRRVITWLVDGGIPLAQRWLEEEIDRYTEPLAAIGAVQGRLGETLAILATAARVCEAVGAPMPACDPLGAAYFACAGSGVAADQARVALDRVYSLATAKPAAFLGQFTTAEQERKDQPAGGGWLGFWDPGTEWDHLDVYPHVVEDELKRGGFAIDAVLKAWEDRGWIECNHGRRCRFRRDGKRVTVYRFLRPALEGGEE